MIRIFKKRYSLKKIIMIYSVIILFLCGFYLNFENTTLQVTKYDITDNKLPENFNNFKIVQISDYHNTNSTKLSKNLIKEIKKQEPNIIVLTGDLIDARKTNINIAINFIKQIKDIAPIYYITGNHEASSSEYKKLKEEMINLGINILENKVAVIQKNNEQLNLIGINDPKFTKEVSIGDSEIIRRQIDNLKYDKDIYTILLSHRPEAFNTYVNKNINLILSGHAHGGQIRIPFIGGVIAPNQGLFPEYTSGKYKKENSTMVVSRGIGNSIIPFRINNRPELKYIISL